MAELLMTLNGETTNANLYEDSVELSQFDRVGMLGKGGSKKFFINQITSVQVTPATALSVGWIFFSVPGDKAPPRNVTEAKRNQNSVWFKKGENEKAEQMKTKIEEIMRSANSNSSSSSGASEADELLKFKNLLDAGAITQEEYDAKKKQLLGL